MSSIPPARPIGTITDPTQCTIRPALDWEARPDRDGSDWGDIRYEIGRPVGANGAIAKITINRPEARNAVNGAVAQGLADAVRHLDERDELRVGVLTGAGGAFCSGMDL